MPIAMRKIWLFVFIFGFVSAQSNKYAGEFLTFSGNAKNYALSGVDIWRGNRIYSSATNPAMLAFSEYESFQITGEHRFGGEVGFDSGQYATGNNKREQYAVGWAHVGISSIPDTRNALLDYGADGKPNTNDAGENNGIIDDGERIDPKLITYFSDHEMALLFSYGKRRGENSAIGATLKILHKRFAEFQAYGLGFDLGYFREIGNFAFSFVVRDPGTTYLFWDTEKTERFEPTIESGIGWRWHSFKNFGVNVGILCIVRSEGQSLSSHFVLFDKFGGELAAGIELKIRRKISIRFGQNARNKFTCGGGLQLGRLHLDYAFALPRERVLEYNHRLSVGFLL